MSPRWEKKGTTMTDQSATVVDETPPEFSDAFNERDQSDSRKLEKAIDTFTEAVTKRRVAEPKKDHSFPNKWGLVKIEQKRTEHDIDDVPVCVNGKNVLLKRDEWTPVNWAFVEALRNAKHPIYGHKPGQLRQQVGMNTRFPHQVHEINEVEFKKLRAAATKRSLTMEDIPERYQSVVDISAA
jgi:hypothetical protein